MPSKNELSDSQIANSFEQVLISLDDDAICDRRRAISVIASRLEDFAKALPQTYKITWLDMQALSAQALNQNENNIIGFLEENGYSAQLAYQMINMDQHEAA